MYVLNLTEEQVATLRRIIIAWTMQYERAARSPDVIANGLLVGQQQMAQWAADNRNCEKVANLIALEYKGITVAEGECDKLMAILQDWSHNFAEHVSPYLEDESVDDKHSVNQRWMNDNCDHFIEQLRKVI